jgi:hypothetical protein
MGSLTPSNPPSSLLLPALESFFSLSHHPSYSWRTPCSEDYLNSTIEDDGNEQPFVAPGTQAERDRICIAWTMSSSPPSQGSPTYSNLDITPRTMY